MAAPLACPSATKHWAAGGAAPLYTFSLNYYVASNRYDSGDRDAVKKFVEIARPGSKFYAVDGSALTKSAGDNIIRTDTCTHIATTGWPMKTGNRGDAVMFRHSAKANVVFCDGHCGTFIRNDLAGGGSKIEKRYILPRATVY